MQDSHPLRELLGPLVVLLVLLAGCSYRPAQSGPNTNRLNADHRLALAAWSFEGE